MANTGEDKGSNNPEYHGNEEIIERNVERAREVIEKKANDENSGQAQAPGPSDPQRVGDPVAPGQWNRPIGGFSNPNFQGGSSKRQKPN